jgi:nitrate reductase gamma subunit
MESLLDFARGPLFRLCFTIMILGLARILSLDVWAIYKAYRKAGDKRMPWKLILSRAWEWFFPVKRISRNFQMYSVISILFHAGLIIVPLFLLAHIQLWKGSVGISWIALPYGWTFSLTIATIVLAVSLFIGRLVIKQARLLSRKQDYLWLLLLLLPFATGFICSNLNISPQSYQFFMLIHVLSGELIFILIPFSKIAHCVLAPLSQVVCAVAWKFPPKTDDDICTTLNKKGAPI